MKAVFSLMALLIATAFLLSSVSSYHTAVIRTGAELTIAPENKALIAIAYGKDNKFTVTNNTENTLEINRVELLGSPFGLIIAGGETNPVELLAGGVQEFMIPGDFESLSGRVIQLNTRWDGGKAEVNSTIPVLSKENWEGHESETNH